MVVPLSGIHLPHSFRVSVSLLSKTRPTNLSNSAKNSALSVSCAPSTDVFGYAPDVPGKANMADPLTRQDRVFAQMNSIEFSLDLELDDNEELSAGFENDSELSDIIRRLTSTRQDTLHEQ